MAVIKRPSPSGSTSINQVTSAGRAATAAVGVGEVTQALGGIANSIGAEYMQKAQAALSTAVYDNAMHDATEEFNKAYQERVNTPFDKNGQPTSGTLAQDTQDIGDAALQRQAGFLLDPMARQQFTRNFGNHISTQAIKAGSVARAQEADYQQTTMVRNKDATLAKLQTAAPSEAQAILGQYTQSIQTQVQAGFLSESSAAVDSIAMSQAASRLVINQISAKDPLSVIADLSQIKEGGSYHGFELNATEVADLMGYAQGSAADLDKRQQKDVDRIAAEKKKEQATNNTVLTTGIGTLTSYNDINDSFMAGKIDKFQRAVLVQKKKVSDIKAAGSNTTAGDVQFNIDNNQSSVNTDAERDVWFNQMVANSSQTSADGEGGLTSNVSITDMAPLVADVGAPVPAYQKQLVKGIDIGGDAGVQSLNAYSVHRDKDKGSRNGTSMRALKGMDKIASSLLEMAYFNTRTLGMGQQEGYAKADAAMFNLTPEEVEWRTGKGGTTALGDFQPDTVVETLNDMLDSDDWTYRRDREVSPDLKFAMTQLARQHYVATGQSGDALAASVKLGMDAIARESYYGESSDRGTPVREQGGFLAGNILDAPEALLGALVPDKGEYMRQPPELVLGAQFQPAIKADFHEVETNLRNSGELPVDATLFIRNIPGTLSNKSRAVYALWYRDEKGNPVPIADPWEISEKLLKDSPSDRVQEALAMQERAVNTKRVIDASLTIPIVQ